MAVTGVFGSVAEAYAATRPGYPGELYDRLAELAASSPGVLMVRGDGNALPLRDRGIDFVTYAQAWHWTDPDRAVPEFRRVLRPGGAFAAWWNLTDRQEPWAAAQERRLAAACPTYHQVRARYPDAATRDPAALPYGLPMRTAEFRWARRVPLGAHLANLNSKSYLAALRPDLAGAFLETERTALLAEFPDGLVTERYRTMLEVVPA